MPPVIQSEDQEPGPSAPEKIIDEMDNPDIPPAYYTLPGRLPFRFSQTK